MNDLVPDVRITGSVKYRGKDIFALGTDVNELRRQIGMVFQKPNPFPMSIYDNIAYGTRTHGVRSKAQLDEIVENYKKTKAGFECEVTKENINAVLGTEDFEILDNAKIIFVFENKNLVSIECVFKTTSSKDVTIYTTYTY